MRHTSALAALLLPLLVAVPCHAAPDTDEELPAGVIAIVGERKLTFDRFCEAVVQQALPVIKRQKAGPRMLLEQLIEEVMVLQECKRLGIRVSTADVSKQWDQWDRRLRVSSNGERTLRQSLKEQGTSEGEFRHQILHILRKERVAQHKSNLGKRLPKNETAKLAQIGIVIAELRKRTEIKYGIPTVEHENAGIKPAKLPAGHVVHVNGEPITHAHLGRALVIRSSDEEVRGYLDRECKTALMQLEGMGLTDAEFNQEVEHLRELWPLQRQLQREELWSTVSFDERFKADFKGPVEDARNDRYVKGLIGLVRRMRATVTDEEIRKEYEHQKDTRLGDHIVVTDVQIVFAQKSGLLVGRSLKDARRLAGDIVRRQASGEAFEKIAAAINKKQDRGFQAKRIRLYKPKTYESKTGKKSSFDRDLELYKQAERMRDGDVTSPFETLSAVHVMRREGTRAARTLDEVRVHLRDVIAKRKAREWIETRIKNPKYVRIRWPLEARR